MCIIMAGETITYPNTCRALSSRSSQIRAHKHTDGLVHATLYQLRLYYISLFKYVLYFFLSICSVVVVAAYYC